MPHCNTETLEKTIRKIFRDKWLGWIETYQPGQGGGAGVPDAQIMAHPPLIVPIEMKRGTIKNGRLFSDTIRPVQVSWHTRLAVAGGKSYFYIGAMYEGQLRLFLAEAMLVLAMREQGLIINGERVLKLLPSDTSKDFTSVIKNFLL